jgi:hypothetical protein
MIRMARELDKVVITATQMMESMIQPGAHARRGQRRGQRGARRHRRRDAQRRDGGRQVPGGDGRADGADRAGGRARREVRLETDFTNKRFGRIDQSIAMGALFTAHHLGCKAIIALTESGSTALWMSRHNIKVPIYGLTTQVVSQRKHGAVPQRAPILMPKHTTATGAGRGRAAAGGARRAQARRHLRHHLRRADGLPGRHQHAQGLPRRLTRVGRCTCRCRHGARPSPPPAATCPPAPVHPGAAP